MNGTIVAKDQNENFIDYMVEVDGETYYISSAYPPYEDFDIGDEVTLNGTIFDSMPAIIFDDDFGGLYSDDDYYEIELNEITIDGKDYGQMRLEANVNDPYY